VSATQRFCQKMSITCSSRRMSPLSVSLSLPSLSSAWGSTPASYSTRSGRKSCKTPESTSATVLQGGDTTLDRHCPFYRCKAWQQSCSMPSGTSATVCKEVTPLSTNTFPFRSARHGSNPAACLQGELLLQSCKVNASFSTGMVTLLKRVQNLGPKP